MSVKVVAIGDPHFRIDNIEEVELFIEKITVLVEKENPDFVVCLGDLLHTHERLHTTVLNKAYEFVKKIQKYKLYILVGNHDYIQNQQFLTENHWMNAMKEWQNITIVDKIKHLTIKNLNFLFSPYVPNGRFMDALDTFQSLQLNSIDCIFAHQEFYGCKMGAIVSIEGDSWNLEHPNVISGHIHSNQKPQPNIYYPGSAMQHAFGESDRNIIPVLTFEKDGTYKVVEVDLDLPRKKIIYSNLDDPKLLDKSGKNIKLTLSGNDYNEFKTFKKSETYKKLIESGSKVVFKTTKEMIEIENHPVSEDIDFKKILYNTINKDPNLLELYDLIINDIESITINMVD
jgi:DNA repair exonuclease SbcCD nuclease subunit